MTSGTASSQRNLVLLLNTSGVTAWTILLFSSSLPHLLQENKHITVMELPMHVDMWVGSFVAMRAVQPSLPGCQFSFLLFPLI